MLDRGPRARWWGSRGHITFTVVVFVILASLDNAVMGIIPPLYELIAIDLSVKEASVGLATALSILIVAISSVMWGFWGDRGSRKRLLLYGTLLWGVGAILVGFSQTYVHLLVFQMITAVGLGCIASVGFSVVSDLIVPTRRGLFMSLWGLSQGLGTVGGLLLGGLLGAENWRLPFFVVAVAGLAFAVLYLFTYDPKRGRTEPELSRMFDLGEEYKYSITSSDIPRLFTRRSNIWLVAQGFTAQFAYGSLIWLPRLFSAKVEAEGYSVETATKVGVMFATVFQVGGIFSILGGHLGDVWQKRNPRGRAMLSAIGILGAIPFYLALFFLPLHGLDFPEEAGIGVVGTVLKVTFTNIWVAGAFLLSLAALALTSIDSPNWLALISDVNLPEHRGTVFGLANLSNGIGRASGNGLTGFTFAYFTARFASPTSFSMGLAVFQLFFLPTALCYYMATKTTPKDIGEKRETLAARTKAIA